MNLRTNFDVQLIQATRHHVNATNGLMTFQFHLARDIWTEVLTHRAAARNASSRRAMSSNRIIATHGAWVPEVFYAPSSGMGYGDPVSPADQERARILWCAALEDLEAKILELNTFVCKTQANRLLTGAHITAGVVTMTEEGWSHFLSLRNTEQADPAMYQLLASEVEKQIKEAQWTLSDWHKPYWPTDYKKHQGALEFENCILIACARIARVSYGSTKGRSIEDDLALARQLLKDKHLSPFEHICRAVEHPTLSALNCLLGDRWHGFGWETYRDFSQKRNGA